MEDSIKSNQGSRRASFLGTGWGRLVVVCWAAWAILQWVMIDEDYGWDSDGYFQFGLRGGVLPLVVVMAFRWVISGFSRARNAARNEPSIPADTLAAWVASALATEVRDLAMVKVVAVAAGFPEPDAARFAAATCYFAATGTGALRDQSRRHIDGAKAKVAGSPNLQRAVDAEVSKVRPDLSSATEASPAPSSMPLTGVAKMLGWSEDYVAEVRYSDALRRLQQAPDSAEALRDARATGAEYCAKEAAKVAAEMSKLPGSEVLLKPGVAASFSKNLVESAVGYDIRQVLSGGVPDRLLAPGARGKAGPPPLPQKNREASGIRLQSGQQLSAEEVQAWGKAIWKDRAADGP